jgi:hypothetical protein
MTFNTRISCSRHDQGHDAWLFALGLFHGEQHGRGFNQRNNPFALAESHFCHAFVGHHCCQGSTLVRLNVNGSVDRPFFQRVFAAPAQAYTRQLLALR